MFYYLHQKLFLVGIANFLSRQSENCKLSRFAESRREQVFFLLARDLIDGGLYATAV